MIPLKKIIKKIVPKSVLNLYASYLRYNEIRQNRGSVYFCPICKKSFNQLNQFGDPPRKNAMCFKCHSLERHRLLYWFLETKINLFTSVKNISLLHFAPEVFLFNKITSTPGITYHPVDYDPAIYHKKGLTEVNFTDITNIPHSGNTFDLIICNHVLEHIPDDAKAISEIYRVLKPGGQALLMIPIDFKRKKTYEDFSITSMEDRKIHFGQEDHVRWYAMDFVERLKDAGFLVQFEDEAIGLTSALRKKMAIPDVEILFVCTKNKVQ